MDVTNRGEALNGALHVGWVDHDHEVDHRLGGETGDRRGADVLDRDDKVANCCSHALASRSSSNADLHRAYKRRMRG